MQSKVATDDSKHRLNRNKVILLRGKSQPCAYVVSSIRRFATGCTGLWVKLKGIIWRTARSTGPSDNTVHKRLEALSTVNSSNVSVNFLQKLAAGMLASHSKVGATLNLKTRIVLRLAL